MVVVIGKIKIGVILPVMIPFIISPLLPEKIFNAALRTSIVCSLDGDAAIHITQIDTAITIAQPAFQFPADKMASTHREVEVVTDMAVDGAGFEPGVGIRRECQAYSTVYG